MIATNRQPGRLARLLLGLALVLSFLGLAPTATYAASLTVTTLADSGEGSLRAAIDAANGQAGADTITFDVTGTIVLGSTLPTISAPLTIDGPGRSSLTISGNNAVSVFNVDSSTLNLSGVTVANGASFGFFADGGGITSRRSAVTIADSAFSANRSEASGGAILSIIGSTLTIANSDFSGNSANTGGVIYSNNGTVVDLSGSTFSGNSAVTGGVLFSVGKVTISDSSFSTNTAQSNVGGVIFLAGDDSTLTIANSTFADNGASSGGGVLFNNGTATVAASTFSANIAGGSGGVMSNNGTMSISASTIADNHAQFSGGAIMNSGTMTIANSTIAGNTSAFSGGGLYNGIIGTVTVSSSTFSGNSSPDGGGIRNYNTATAKNTVIANSPAGGNCVGTLTDQGGNLSSDATCGYTAAGSRNDTDPRLGALQGNGGPTRTIALQAGSPAIDAAVDCPPPAADQRGVARPQGAACDSGAFEVVDQSPPQITPSVGGTLGANGWYVSDVAVTWNVAEPESTVTRSSGCTATTLTSDTAGVTFTCTATSVGGTSSQSITIKRDATAPVVSVTGVTEGAIYALGSVPAAGCSPTTDALSGVATAATLSLTGGNADGTGRFTASCSGATDNAGNAGQASVHFTVAYRWSGFFQPVDNLPTVNSVKAGSAVPVKFSLGGNYGLNIFAGGAPTVQTVACTGGAPIDEVETTVTAGASSLQYDAATGQYSYIWKTDKKWAGSCRLLTVRLTDGTEHTALFQFR